MQDRKDATPWASAPASEGDGPGDRGRQARGASRPRLGRGSDHVERTLEMAREALGMDVAFVSEVANDRMEFRAPEGDAESFWWHEGGGVPLNGTFCKRLVDDTLPNVVPDAGSGGRVSSLDVTREAGIGSYIGVPLKLSNMRVNGTLVLPVLSVVTRGGDGEGAPGAAVGRSGTRQQAARTG